MTERMMTRRAALIGILALVPVTAEASSSTMRRRRRERERRLRMYGASSVPVMTAAQAQAETERRDREFAYFKANQERMDRNFSIGMWSFGALALATFGGAAFWIRRDLSRFKIK